MSSILVSAPTPVAPPRPSRTAPPATTGGWADVFGTTWRIELLALLAFVLVGGTLRPLWDADLPMHLATGEWIARHHAAPTVEPFAWTAVGEPFYSHSWAPQVVFYLVFSALGPLGLRALNGLLLATAAASAFALGRARRWPPAVTLAVSALNVIVAALVTTGLRPQLLLFTVIPLSWAIVSTLVHAERPRVLYVALFAVSVAAVNSHLFFSLVLAPVFALWAIRQLPVRRAATAAAVVALSWVVTPYALEWPRVLGFMGAHGAIFRYPSPIAELEPGFIMLTAAPLSPPLFLAVLPLLAVPWLLAGESTRLRVVAGLYWTAGLVGFAMAGRLVAIWWLLAFPFVGGAFAARHATGPGRPVRPGVKWLTYSVSVLALGLQLRTSAAELTTEGVSPTRDLPTDIARAVPPLADWLVARTRPAAGGHILTGFDYGGYLTWRLPSYSASVDSRGSFADSLLAPQMYVSASSRREHLGPWRSADLAVVPIRWRVAAVLDTASDWRRVATATAERAPSDTVGLWVRGAWWNTVGRAPLPAAPVFLVASRNR